MARNDSILDLRQARDGAKYGYEPGTGDFPSNSTI